MNWKSILISVAIILHGSCGDQEEIDNGCLPIVLDEDRFENLIVDPTLSIREAKIDEDCLILEFEYTGGCEEHQIELIGNGKLAYSNPPQMSLSVHHDNTDPCDALLYEQWIYSLDEIEHSIGEVIIHVSGWDQPLHFKP